MHHPPRSTWIFLILLGIGWAASGISNEVGGQPPGEVAERPLVTASQPLLRAGPVQAELSGPLHGEAGQTLDVLPSGSRAPEVFATAVARHPEALRRFCRSILGGRSSARAPPLEIG